MKSDKNNSSYINKLYDTLRYDSHPSMQVESVGSWTNPRSMPHPSPRFRFLKQRLIGGVLAGFVVLMAAFGNGPVLLVDGKAVSDQISGLTPGLHTVFVKYLGFGDLAPSAYSLAGGLAVTP